MFNLNHGHPSVPASQPSRHRPRARQGWPKATAQAVRSHWAVENSLHWVLAVTFKDDLSRVRTGHGAKNMAVVRHFAFDLVRAMSDKRTLKTRRKRAAWDPSDLASILDMNVP